jgi:mono/diheme cytochrome c family protein
MYRSLRNTSVVIAAFFVLLAIPVILGHLNTSGASAVNAFAKPAPDDKEDAALVAKGKERYKAYGCPDCHGENGQGAPDGDAPDLTHSKRTAEQVSAFLQKPSADAAGKGMPDVPKDSPDHAPLVAYVMSIRAK